MSLTHHVPVSWGNGLCNYVNKSETNFGLLRCYWRRWEGLESPGCLPDSKPCVLASQSTVGSFSDLPPGELAEGFIFEPKLDKTQAFLSFMGRFLLSARTNLPGVGQARR